MTFDEKEWVRAADTERKQSDRLLSIIRNLITSTGGLNKWRKFLESLKPNYETLFHEIIAQTKQDSDQAEEAMRGKTSSGDSAVDKLLQPQENEDPSGGISRKAIVDRKVLPTNTLKLNRMS